MSAAIPSLEPTTLTAGDTATWTKSLPDYLVTDGWVLTYAFRLQQGSGKVDVTAGPSGSDFTVTMLATVTAQMKPGLWMWAAFVTKGAERHQVDSGLTTVTVNLATLDSQTDLRSDAKIAFDNAQAAWRTFSVSKMVTLNGRTYTSRDAGDLIKYVDRCRQDYQAEVNANSLATKSGMNPRHIGVRFGDA